jgi:serine/threonine-protein kinase HipA
MSVPIEVDVDVGGNTLRAGILYAHSHGRAESATFTYRDDYLADQRAYALDPALPLSGGAHQTPPDRALFGAFADSAPDRWGRRLATRHHVQASSGAPRTLREVDFLLGVRDDLRQGAIRYRIGGSEAYQAPDAGPIPRVTNLAYLLDLAERSQRGQLSPAELRLLLDSGSSLGGARPKVHVLADDGSVSIAKYPSDDTDTWNVCAWEAVSLRIAAAMGCQVPSSRVLTIGGRSVLLLKRFDRAGDWRVGYWSALTALELMDGDRGSFVDMAAFLEEHGSSPRSDLRQVWLHAVVDMLVHNTDNHLRNYAFLRDRAGWTVSPRFDINPDPAAGEHATMLLPGAGGGLTVTNLLESAPLFAIAPEEAPRLLGDAAAVAGRWREVARSTGLTNAEADAMAPAFDNDEAIRAREMVGRS